MPPSAAAPKLKAGCLAPAALPQLLPVLTTGFVKKCENERAVQEPGRVRWRSHSAPCTGLHAQLGWHPAANQG